MPKAEVPVTWNELLDLGRRSGTSPAFMKQLEGFSETTDQTVYREFMGNRPPQLPGVGQAPAYMRGVFIESGAKLDEETARQKVAMRLGVWSLFLENGGNLETIIDKRALTRRPEGIGEEAMLQTLNWTLCMANRSQVSMRILQDGAFAEQPHDSFGLTYMRGLEAGGGTGDLTPTGRQSVVLVDELSDVRAMERTWADADAAALSVDESRLLIEAALHDLQHNTSH